MLISKVLVAIGILLMLVAIPTVTSQATYHNCLVVIKGNYDRYVERDNCVEEYSRYDTLIVSYRDTKQIDIYIAGTTPYKVDSARIYIKDFEGWCLKNTHKIFMIGFVNTIEVI